MFSLSSLEIKRRVCPGFLFFNLLGQLGELLRCDMFSGLLLLLLLQLMWQAYHCCCCCHYRGRLVTAVAVAALGVLTLLTLQLA